jgi:hypothetical protein
MSSTVETAIDIRLFNVDIPDEALEDPRRRIAATNWPERATVFPGEQYQAPRSWAEQACPNLIYFNEVDRGGYFAAWEQPQLCAEEIRAAFHSLR